MGRIRLKARYREALHPGVVATTHGCRKESV
jgi:hypothetical protein